MSLAVLLFWLAIGVGIGVLHARLLWSRRLPAFARLGVVGGCLLAAALAGGVLPAAAGWFAGLFGQGLLLLRRAAR